jgi:hypothetical protein
MHHSGQTLLFGVRDSETGWGGGFDTKAGTLYATALQNKALIAEQGAHLRHPVQGGGLDDPRHRRRS